MRGVPRPRNGEGQIAAGERFKGRLTQAQIELLLKGHSTEVRATKAQ